MQSSGLSAFVVRDGQPGQAESVDVRGRARAAHGRAEAQRLDFFEHHRDSVLRQLGRTQEHLAAIEAKIATYRAVVTVAASDRSDGPVPTSTGEQP